MKRFVLLIVINQEESSLYFNLVSIINSILGCML